MRFYESQSLERIGFDFYCDIAGRMAETRKRKGWTQEILAEKAGVTLSRIAKMENVKIRFYLKDIEKLAGILDVTVNWLIDAEIDSQIDECLYLVWPESAPDFKLYQKATSKRMAFLLFDKRFKAAGVAYSSSRERVFVKLVGVPITKAEIRDRFPKLTSDEEPIEPRGGQA